MRPKSTSAKKPAEQVVKDIRRATRRHFSAEDKIRIVLEGLRGDDSLARTPFSSAAVRDGVFCKGSSVGLPQFLAYHPCSVDHRFQFRESEITRDIFHAAVGSHHDALGFNITERASDSGGDDVGILGFFGRKIQDAEDDRLAVEFLQNRAI